MWINHVIMGALAMIAGVAVSAGTFAFILVIGVIPRMLRKANLAKKSLFIENVIVIGGGIGCLMSVVLNFRLLGAAPGESMLVAGLGHAILILYGLSAGIFVGCISVALAEILNTFPIMFRRLGIKRGLTWVMIAMAFGKMVGALYSFYGGFAM